MLTYKWTHIIVTSGCSVAFVFIISDLEEFHHALKWIQHCLTDVQSQQDVELIMLLLATEDFKNAYSVYRAVSQQKSRPLTVQAEDLYQEVHYT